MRQGAPNGHALVELRHLRRANEREQLRLPNENDLNQLLAVRLEVRQHANLLEEFRREVLCFVEDRDARTAGGELLEEECVQLVEELLARRRLDIAQPKLGQQGLKHLDATQER